MQLPGYQILEELGRGGMGVVYKARQIHLNRLVALKMILAGPHASQDALARFSVEAQAAARLDHPNIIRVYDFGEQQGVPYFSMELISGGSLSRKMGGQPWPITAAIDLMTTLAQAMHHAHQENVIHRDLKPANVLFHKDGSARITDFGLAKQLDSNLDLTDTGHIMGSARYMSPEQAAGDISSIGPPTDVHALGVILYELLAGRPAFDGGTMFEALEQVRYQEPIPLSALRPEAGEELERICRRCLDKNPRQRYPSAERLARDLQAASVARPPPVSGQHSEPTRLPPDRSEWWRI